MRDADLNLERIIPTAQRLSASGPQTPVLARLDSGFGSTVLMGAKEACNRKCAGGLPQFDWLIKWNPHSTNVATLVQTHTDDRITPWDAPREGKRVTLWERHVTVDSVQRRVFCSVERTINAAGRRLLMPQHTLEAGPRRCAWLRLPHAPLFMDSERHTKRALRCGH